VPSLLEVPPLLRCDPGDSVEIDALTAARNDSAARCACDRPAARPKLVMRWLSPSCRCHKM